MEIIEEKCSYCPATWKAYKRTDKDKRKGTTVVRLCVQCTRKAPIIVADNVVTNH
jgi:hypothetical protein